PSSPRWGRRLLHYRQISSQTPPPPSLPRWGEGLCTRCRGLPSQPRPHRACLGGARASALQGSPIQSRPHRACPGGTRASALQRPCAPNTAPAELASVERGLLHSGARTSSQSSLRSTEASSVGAVSGVKSVVVQKPAPHR